MISLGEKSDLLSALLTIPLGKSSADNRSKFLPSDLTLYPDDSILGQTLGNSFFISTYTIPSKFLGDIVPDDVPFCLLLF